MCDYLKKHKCNHKKACCGNKICCSLKCGAIWYSVLDTLIFLQGILSVLMLSTTEYDSQPDSVSKTTIIQLLACLFMLIRIAFLFPLCCTDSLKLRKYSWYAVVCTIVPIFLLLAIGSMSTAK